MAKVEIATMAEKVNAKTQEVERLDEELKSVRHTYKLSVDEAQALQAALDDARSNSDRLHKESEQVVMNVNGWVDEQKYVYMTYIQQNI